MTLLGAAVLSNGGTNSANSSQILPTTSATPQSTQATPSPAAPVTDETWKQVKSEFSQYSEDLPGTWSRAIPGGQFQGEGPLGIAVQVHAGELVLHGHTLGDWGVLEATGVQGETIEGMSTEVVDTTNGGGADLLVTLELADGSETGTVAFNFGRFAAFDDSEGTYGFVSGLAMAGGDLVGGGTKWIYQDGEARFVGEVQPETDPLTAAEDSLQSYRQGKEGTWSDPIAGAGYLDAVAVQGTSKEVVVHAFVDGQWTEIDSSSPDWTSFSDYSFKIADTTGQGGDDIVLRATDDDGDSYGAVVFNTGRFATFTDGDGNYGYWSDLEWDGRELSDPYGTTFTYLPGEATFEAN